MDNLKVAILGSTGYTGIELLKILDNHPKASIKFLGANRNTKLKAQSLFSGLKNSINVSIRNNYDIKNYKDIDVVFSCMPQGVLSKNFSKFKFKKDQCLIDLSGDFRLPENLNKKWYGIKRNKDIYKKFQYIIPELNTKKIRTKFVSNPGCYATSIALAIAPLSKVLSTEIIIDSKSGISGAGKNINIQYLFNEANENFSIYNAGEHRHAPEVENFIKVNYKKKINIFMVPQLLPITRGILSNVYVTLRKNITETSLKNIFIKFYKDKNFIKVLSSGLPSIKDVLNTNNCIIGIKKIKNTQTFMITSVIDNLLKGASGQAVQNMNLIFGFEENLGL